MGSLFSDISVDFMKIIESSIIGRRVLRLVRMEW